MNWSIGLAVASLVVLVVTIGQVTWWEVKQRRLERDRRERCHEAAVRVWEQAKAEGQLARVGKVLSLREQGRALMDLSRMRYDPGYYERLEERYRDELREHMRKLEDRLHHQMPLPTDYERELMREWRESFLDGKAEQERSGQRTRERSAEPTPKAPGGGEVAGSRDEGEADGSEAEAGKGGGSG